ncbi:type III-B CRISPR-associated protein Cas10/Cmr2 [Candidatus Contubernalis alkaliaceticus]|uniref:type III-B CRISPR-associated protein Cas10/Cmr2 n=1 Tax=Candidatus Contubernalis alkaliaceticus TaxID=338645 RepID=UPI001F4C1C61|nr:type III-B CRISPR-associated protein Cas10/Cmr2 [Candidatus Contubernalis alkalaceticus]UNC93168.1 type III-B CRISPR-associated protein Cas10/Cmr2 [Candidatus Contubernalis alkalaceticus]
MKKNSLIGFNVGPVQSFIAAARKVEDLWSGSYLLSYLTETAMKSVLKQAKTKGVEAKMVFPDRTLDMLDSNQWGDEVEVASLPNRFVCLIEQGQEESAQFCIVAKERVYEEFLNLCKSGVDEVFKKSNVNINVLKEMVQKQVEATLEVFWVVEELGHDYNETRHNLERHLAAIKNNLKYPQVRQEGIICSVCGSHEALRENIPQKDDTIYLIKKELKKTWNKRNETYKSTEPEDNGRIKNNEFLCGVCLGKRTSREFFRKKRKVSDKYFNYFPSTITFAEGNNYYGILLADGDNMGKWFKGDISLLNTGSPGIELQQKISKRLTDFSQNTVPKLVKKFGGRLIYAGGDDLLAFVPMSNILSLALELRNAFGSKEKGLAPEATMSAGIVIAHVEAPLKRTLNFLRDLEQTSKKYINPLTGQGKDALSLAILSRSGEMRTSTIPWVINGNSFSGKLEDCTVTLFNTIIKAMQEDLSSTFHYRFASAFLPLLGSNVMKKKIAVFSDEKNNRELITIEIARLLKRSLKENSKQFDINDLASKLVMLYENMPSTLQFIHLLQIAKFFVRQEGGDKLEIAFKSS